jgi:RNA polymerase sigma-70 factor (ECF subfamily)
MRLVSRYISIMAPLRETPNGRAHLRLAASNPEAVTASVAPSDVAGDERLLAALRACDASAAAALHDRARPIVQRTLSRLLGRRDSDYEDVAQLALIELVTTIERFRGDCSLDGWIAMITARVVYKHIRRRKTERKIFGPFPVEPALEQRAQHAREGLLRGVIARVRSHLESLEENKAWTFVLHDVCGYDLRETAQITGVSVAAAQTRLTRGRRELHEKIGADPELHNWIEDTGGVL